MISFIYNFRVYKSQTTKYASLENVKKLCEEIYLTAKWPNFTHLMRDWVSSGLLSFFVCVVWSLCCFWQYVYIPTRKWNHDTAYWWMMNIHSSEQNKSHGWWHVLAMLTWWLANFAGFLHFLPRQWNTTRLLTSD